jgi:accessory gene regulator protein AgrB
MAEKEARKNEYIPGVCNIGEAEIRMRAASGWAGLAGVIVLWAILALVHSAQVWRLFVFLPASLAAAGFYQAALHFCAGFGMKGVFNFGPDVGKTDTVIQAEFRKKDRQKAVFILLLSALTGAAAALAAFFIKF